MTDGVGARARGAQAAGTFRRVAAVLEVDARLLAMFAVLAAIAVGFEFATGGFFLTARNLFNLSLQTSVVAIMATGMVLVIVSRHIDLSVGSMMGLGGHVRGRVPGLGVSGRRRLQLDRHAAHLHCVRRAAGRVPGILDRLSRAAVVHRHAGRPARVAGRVVAHQRRRHHLAHGRDLPEARRRPRGDHRRDLELGGRRARHHRDRLLLRAKPAAQAALRASACARSRWSLR